MAQYGIFFTQIGRDKIASATEGNPLDITHIAVGDGGGGYPEIDDSITSLVNELGRYPINGTSTPAPTQRQFSAVVPPDIGPAVIRERGLIDSDGDLIAIAQAEPIEMPAPGPNAVSVTVGILATFNNADYVRAIVDLQGFVRTTRKVIAGTGLTGGGALTEDVTIKADIASKSQAEGGTADNVLMTPERVNQAIQALAPDVDVSGKADKTYVDQELNKKVDKVSGKGLSTNDYTNSDKQAVGTIGDKLDASSKASKSEAESGGNNTKYMTPLRTKEAIRSTPASATETGGIRIRLDEEYAVLYIRTDGQNA